MTGAASENPKAPTIFRALSSSLAADFNVGGLRSIFCRHCPRRRCGYDMVISNQGMAW